METKKETENKTQPKPKASKKPETRYFIGKGVEITEEQAKKLEKKMRENAFTLEDYLVQFDAMKKMGGIKDVLSMMPGAGKMKLGDADIDESKIEKTKAIIRSMTPKERRDPNIINFSRKNRIAKGSGTTVQDINRLLKQFEQTKQMMKRMKNNKMFRF